VCVCVCARAQADARVNACTLITHTLVPESREENAEVSDSGVETRPFKSYIFVCVCVCVCVCLCVCVD